MKHLLSQFAILNLVSVIYLMNAKGRAEKTATAYEGCCNALSDEKDSQLHIIRTESHRELYDASAVLDTKQVVAIRISTN